MGGFQMFQGFGSSRDDYNELQQLHEMNLLFGPFPRNFLNKAKDLWRIAGIFDNEGYVWGPPRPNGSDPEFF
jgi:hypothetical protein